VLTNLLTNGIRHTPRGGTVTVSLATAEPGAVITVDDTGPGIDGDPEVLFDRFHRASDSGGSGLGLTIARQLVEAHGGTITAANRPATSADPGGARFTVVLPSGDVLA
jgi:signal transduction histidine kinase